MRKFLLPVILAFAALPCVAQTRVGGYTRANGTVVAPHIRSSVNRTNADNWSTTGNSNPNTGSNGSRAQDYSQPAGNYGGDRPIQTGPNGGQFYRNDNGNKVYVPKQPR